MNIIFKYFAKKYLLNILNDGLKSAQEKTDVKKYVYNIANIIQFLSVLVEALKDNQISNEEADEFLNKLDEFFK